MKKSTYQALVRGATFKPTSMTPQWRVMTDAIARLMGIGVVTKPASQPEPERELTHFDLARMAKAQARREQQCRNRLQQKSELPEEPKAGEWSGRMPMIPMRKERA